VAMNYINAITGYFSSPAGAVPWWYITILKIHKTQSLSA
jgi:hypothetical protein